MPPGSSVPDVRVSTFAGSPLDRSTPFAAATDDETPPLPDLPSRTLILSPSLDLLTAGQRAAPSVVFPAAAADALAPDAPSYVLGIHDGHLYRARALSALPAPAALAAAAPRAAFRDLRALAAALPRPDAALAAHARSLAEFNRRHAFCGLCGAPTRPDRHGSRRRCARNRAAGEPADATVQNGSVGARACNGIWFPRTDPAVIMLVVNRAATQCLLGRQKAFPQGLYSCLAGFMEHAEGVEDTVRREVHEEAGVRVGRVRFFGSQPWPFPYSLMLGCVALAEGDDGECPEVDVDGIELEDARWFSRQDVREMVKVGSSGGGKQGELSVPPAKIAIAGQLCAAFANNDPITFFETQGNQSYML